MNALQGTVRHGQIVLDDPADLPEGTRVAVHPLEDPQPVLGMREEDWPATPEGIAALLARMDQVEVAHHVTHLEPLTVPAPGNGQ